MKIFLSILFLCLLNAPVFAVEIQKMGRTQDEQGRELCTVKIDFGSFDEKNIDLDTYTKIKAYIENHKNINEATSYPWGSQVGGTFCLVITDPTTLDHVFIKIRDMIPEKSNKFWTKIRTNKGSEFRTKWSDY